LQEAVPHFTIVTILPANATRTGVERIVPDVPSPH
jgi:hypothetical protein